MDGEVVDTLLRLLDERVAVEFPSELVCLSLDLFQSLVQWHGAYRYWRIANDPLSRLVDVASRGEVHNGVSSPADSPDRLLDFLLDRGGDG